MNIIIFGINPYTHMVCRCLSKSVNVIGICDSYSIVEEYAGYRFICKSELLNIKFDYIIVTVSDRKIFDEIAIDLNKNYHISKEKILSFDGMFMEQRADQLMLKARTENKNYQGIILGISHAMCGINPLYLDGNFANVACSGEDIYFHYKVFSKIVREYADVINTLNTIIIDLYDYTVFDHDISQTRDYFGYLRSGGYSEELHNLKKNKFYPNVMCVDDVFAGNSYGSEFSSLYSKKYRSFRTKLFQEDEVFKKYETGLLKRHFFNQYMEFCDETNNSSISNEPMLQYNLYYSKQRHPSTVEENMDALYTLLKLALDFNPKMKIIFTLLPRYYMVEEFHDNLLKQRRDEFCSIIDKISNSYTIRYLDYKHYAPISKNHRFFYDPAHLNNTGAIAFTSILNKVLRTVV